jgi:hypothetical protein
MEKRFDMSQGDVSNPMELVNGVCARAVSDAGLRARLLADPRATLTEETGLTIPEEYLQLVSGGVAHLSRCGDGVERYIGW